jgi:hypothetical protein
MRRGVIAGGKNVMATAHNFGNTVVCVAVPPKKNRRHCPPYPPSRFSPWAAPEGNAPAAGAEGFPLCRFVEGSKNSIVEMLLDGRRGLNQGH